mgnify:FL=1
MEEKFIFSDNIPIYKQLLEQLTEKIIIGTYEPGSKLPSVREFALITGVNPNTVQRALTELEEKSLIITKGTSGKFVTEDKKIISKMKKEVLQSTVDDFLKNMKKLNVSKEEIISYLQGK